MSGWIGVDLDGTLAFYDHWRGNEHIGKPIPAMLQRVKAWLAEGQEVRIVTARAEHFHRAGDNPRDITSAERRQAIVAIRAWCKIHLGREVDITCMKDYGMIALWDDRVIQVVPNTGRSLAEEHEAELTAMRGAP
jgi:hypothetical protein